MRLCCQYQLLDPNQFPPAIGKECSKEGGRGHPVKVVERDPGIKKDPCDMINALSWWTNHLLNLFFFFLFWCDKRTTTALSPQTLQKLTNAEPSKYTCKGTLNEEEKEALFRASQIEEDHNGSIVIPFADINNTFFTLFLRNRAQHDL